MQTAWSACFTQRDRYRSHRKQNIKITNIDNIAEDGNAETPTTRLMIMAFKPALEYRLASSDLQAHIASKGRELTGTAQGFGDEGAWIF